MPTDEGSLYLALVLDLYARKLVGWAMRQAMLQELTLRELDVALGWRDPEAGLVHHSDWGSQDAATVAATAKLNVLDQNAKVTNRGQRDTGEDPASGPEQVAGRSLAHVVLRMSWLCAMNQTWPSRRCGQFRPKMALLALLVCTT